MKIRADELLVRQGLATTRSQAKLLILEGKVPNIAKPGQLVDPSTKLSLEVAAQYVSRGAYKLQAALEAFQVDPLGLVAADIGASTGGFTQLLIEKGASKVFAVDVGHNQLAPSLKSNPKVISLEKTDIRELVTFPQQPDLAVVDLSFISLRLILPHLAALLKPQAPILVLFKPQFEVGRQKVPKDGVIKDPVVIRQALDEFAQWALANSFNLHSQIPSPVKGKKGNQEYLLYLNRK